MGHGIRIFGVLVGILRHFQTLFCGVVGTEKNLVGEGYNEEQHGLVSHATS